jgi:hypothetical protein
VAQADAWNNSTGLDSGETGRDHPSMADGGDTPDGSTPSFTQLVHSAFAFLVEQGFGVVQADDAQVDRVRYESPVGVFVDVFFVPREQHTGMRVGELASPSDAITDAELRIASQTPKSRPGLARQDEVNELAGLLRRQGDRALRADPDLRNEVAKLRRSYTEGFTAGPSN